MDKIRGCLVTAAWLLVLGFGLLVIAAIIAEGLRH